MPPSSGRGNTEDRVLVGEPEGNTSFERLRVVYNDNIKLDLREIIYDYADWICQAQYRTRMEKKNRG